MSSYNYPVFGMVFGRGGTNGVGAATIGIPLSQRHVDNSVERQKFTSDGEADSPLAWDYARNEGLHISISSLEADNSGSSNTVSERKVFEEGWEIFNAEGEAVGASAGTTDTDITPNE